MSRVPKEKELVRTRLANQYGGWLYCEGCAKTIGYLCYVTYDRFDFQYQCKCGNSGHVRISFAESAPVRANGEPVTIKNRLCCPGDQSPLVTILEKNLDAYRYAVECTACHAEYTGGTPV